MSSVFFSGQSSEALFGAENKDENFIISCAIHDIGANIGDYAP